MAATLCFAANEPVAPPGAFPVAATVPVQGTMKGTVDSTIPLSDTNPPGIVIINEKGEKVKFITNASTVKRDINGKEILLREFKKDDKVVIEYTTTERGIKKVLSIKVVR